MVRPELAGGRADRGGGSSSEIEGEGNARPRRGAKTRGPLAADACAHRRGEFLALNADVQHLSSSLSPTRLQIGSDGEFPASHTDVSVFSFVVDVFAPRVWVVWMQESVAAPGDVEAINKCSPPFPRRRRRAVDAD